MLEYPTAERLDVVEILHGTPVADPYRWLENPVDPRSVVWSAQQDQLATAVLDDLPLRDPMRKRLAEVMSAGEIGLPFWRGERAFFALRAPDADSAGVVLREVDGTERLLIDPAALDPSGKTLLDDWYPSLKGDRIAYLLSEGGAEEAALYVMAVDSGEILEGPIDRCRAGDLSWLPGDESFVYVRRLPAAEVPSGEEDLHRRVFRHRIGESTDLDIELLGSGLDVTNYYWFTASSDGRWLVVHAAAGTSPRTEVWLAEVSGSETLDFRVVQTGTDAWTLAWVQAERLYLITDRGAARGRLCVAPVTAPAFEHWVDLVPEDPEATLVDAVVVGDGIPLVVHSIDAVSRLSYCSATGELQGTVGGMALGWISAVMGKPGSSEAWLEYSNFVTPSTVLQWNSADPALVSVWKTAPGATALANLHVVQRRFASRDGTEVHAFVIAPEETPRHPRPMVLTGYGGFGSTQTPSYDPAALAWVERDAVWVVPNLRGGSENGEDWHRSGMREHKQNTFDDFAAVAAGLIAEGWTIPGQLGVMGGSNGGLLVGAAIVQQPQLYAAAVCSAPLLDMVRYEQFGIGRTWNDEYGSADSAEEFRWLLSYSPYHHVKPATAYPAMLFTVADDDPRVDPLHARKMCAAIQHATTSGRPVILRCETGGGHVARSVSRAVALAADQLAFLAASLAPMRPGDGSGEPR